MKKICANCIYFHPEEYEGKFGGCGVTIDHEKRAVDDTCCDFSESDELYSKEKIQRKEQLNEKASR